MNREQHEKIGEVCFATDVRLSNGTLCKGGGNVMTGLFTNDSLRFCFLTGDEIIQGFPCKGSIMKQISFFDDGRIRKLTLSSDFIYRNQTYPKGSTIELDAQGIVIQPDK
jgi:hypothetical protein